MGVRRKGNRYVTDEEHIKESNDAWKGGILIVAIILSGYFTNFILSATSIEKTYRFLAIIGSVIITGGIVAKFIEQIYSLIMLAIFCGIIYFIGSIIWNSI